MDAQIVFNDGTTLRFADPVIEEIEELTASKGFGFESGGILIGRHISGTHSFEVTLASTPSVLDVGRRYSFLRRMSPANKLIASAWRKSAGIENYLGEWHTHDEAMPVPSATDRALMLQVAEDGSCLFDRAFMLIVGNAGKAYIGAVNSHNFNGFYSERHIKWDR